MSLIFYHQPGNIGHWLRELCVERRLRIQFCNSYCKSFYLFKEMTLVWQETHEAYSGLFGVLWELWAENEVPRSFARSSVQNFRKSGYRKTKFIWSKPRFLLPDATDHLQVPKSKSYTIMHFRSPVISYLFTSSLLSTESSSIVPDAIILMSLSGLPSLENSRFHDVGERKRYLD